MKNLFLIRHAKAEDLREGLTDFSRSLVKKGMKDTEDIAKKIKDKVSGNVLFISSPANRALETAHIFSQKLGYPVEKILLKDAVFNESSSEKFFDILKETEDTYDTVLIFGHNPVISEFASLLMKDFGFDIPKSGVLAFEFARNSWNEIKKHTGILKFSEYPAEKSGKGNQFRKVLSAKISQAISELLNNINPDSSENILKTVEKHAEKIAENFTKDLRRKTHEKPVDK